MGRVGSGKIALDLAISFGMGGDCLAGISVVRAEPAVCGRFASDPTVSRLIRQVAAHGRALLVQATPATSVSVSEI